MPKLILIAATVIALTAASLSAATGVEFELAIYQTDEADDAQVLLYRDTAQFVQGIGAAGFLLAFSLDLDVTAADSAQTAFTVHVVTLGPPANTYARQFAVEYGLPARLSGIRGKGETEYALVMTPLRRVQTDSLACPYNHRGEDKFSLSPTANFDIRYLENSLGAFFWPAVKGLFEDQYRRFMKLCRFTLPGKYDVYLCPCAIPSVIWDQRFAMAVDPSRSSCFAVYTGEFNSADPFLAQHTAVLRNLGYAPPFLSEGLANYLSLAVLDMKEIVAAEEDRPLDELLDTYRYLQADPYLADRTAATLCMYLINAYGYDRFHELYKSSDDLNLRERLAETYQTDLVALEREWRTFIDTLAIPGNLAVYHAELAEGMFNYPLMLRYARAGLERAVNAADSLRSLSVVKRAMFFTGDYYGAADAQAEVLKSDNMSANRWWTLGSYKMMNGEYDDALADLRHARTLDSTDRLAMFNLGLCHRLRGDDSTAAGFFEKVIASRAPGGSSAEARVMLAEILSVSPDRAARARAAELYGEAAALLEVTLQGQPTAASVHLWLGIAQTGLRRFDLARNYLDGALFLESRPFYVGMTNLWLGKLADLEKRRDDAMRYYAETLNVPSSAYHQNEAQQLMENPYVRR